MLRCPAPAARPLGGRWRPGGGRAPAGTVYTVDGKRWTGLDPAYRLQAVLGAGAYGCTPRHGARAGYPESADEASHRARRIRRCGVERMRLTLKMDGGYRHAQQSAGFDAKWPIRREKCAPGAEAGQRAAPGVGRAGSRGHRSLFGPEPV